MSTQRETAKIYPFPVRGRAGVLPHSSGVGGPPVRREPPGVLPAEYGSGWYHDAAIKDALRPPKANAPSPPRGWTPRLA
jgi:hypothetical protein